MPQTKRDVCKCRAAAFHTDKKVMRKVTHVLLKGVIKPFPSMKNDPVFHTLCKNWSTMEENYTSSINVSTNATWRPSSSINHTWVLIYTFVMSVIKIACFTSLSSLNCVIVESEHSWITKPSDIFYNFQQSAISSVSSPALTTTSAGIGCNHASQSVN